MRTLDRTSKVWASARRLSLAGSLLTIGCVSDANDNGQQDLTQLAKDGEKPEIFLYTICNDADPNTNEPGFLAIINADPEDDEYGTIVKRLDVPGEELHHFHYTYDRQHLLIPTLGDSIMNVIDISKPHSPRLAASTDLKAASGYVGPHSVIPQSDGTALITMLGADTESGGPGGIVRLEGSSGEFLEYYGPGPNRAPSSAPSYAYDFGKNPTGNRAVSTNWGWLNDVYPLPSIPFATQVNVWNTDTEEVIQTIDLPNPTFEVIWNTAPNFRRGFIGGGNHLYLFEDDDGDGLYDFHLVIEAGANIVDYRMTSDGQYLFVADWGVGSFTSYDISDPYHPTVVNSVAVPHAGMIHVSHDDKRIFLTNQVVTTYEEAFGLNNNYGIWQFDVDSGTGAISSVTSDGGPWLDTMNVQRQNSMGPVGCHMVEFDPKTELSPLDG